MSASQLSRLPAARVLVPFALGIVLNTLWPGPWLSLLSGLAGVMAWWGIGLCGRDPLRQYALRHWWLAAVALISLAVGAMSLELYRPRPIDLPRVNGQTACGLVEDIEVYDFAQRLQVRLMECGGQTIAPRRILLSTRGCDYDLREGDVVAFESDLQPVTNMGNPDEFDRESHLWQRGILYTQHLPVNQLRQVGFRPTLLARAAALRRHMVSRVLNTSLSPAAQDLLIALLLGKTRQIDTSVRSRFSQAGVAHILALSGLHVGLVTSLIWFLLFPLDYLRLKKLRLLLTLLALLGFAVLTGLSPSVVRATIMIGFTLVAIVLYRKSVALNAMCLAALFTLCIWPTALYQAGFQLSYITVAAIVGLHRKVLPDIGRKHRVVRWLWSLVCTSLIAMSATIMLTAYYFSSFSLLAVLSNVLILPVMPVLMVLGVVFLFLSIIGLEWSALNTSVELIYGYMDRVSQFVSALPGAHFSGVYVTGLSVVLFYVALGCAVVWLLSHKGRWLLGALGVCVLLVVQLAGVFWTSPSVALLVLNDYRSTPILWHENGRIYAWLPDDPTADRDLFEQSHRRLLAHMGTDSLHWVDSNIRTDLSSVRSPWAQICGRRMLVAGRGMNHAWLDQASRIDSVDLLVVTKRYHGRLGDVIAACRPGRVLLSGDLPDDRHKQYLDSCLRLGIKCHDIKTSGAYVDE